MAGLNSYGLPGKRSGWSRVDAAGPGDDAWCVGDGKHSSSWGWWWWSTPAKTLQQRRASDSLSARTTSKPRKPRRGDGEDGQKVWIWTLHCLIDRNTRCARRLRHGPACVGGYYSGSLESANSVSTSVQCGVCSIGTTLDKNRIRRKGLPPPHHHSHPLNIVSSSQKYEQSCE